MSDKEPLRRRMRQVRREVPPEDRARLAALVEDRLFSLPEVASARTVLLFYSVGTEVETSAMAGRVLAEGKRLLLPFVDPGGMEAGEVLPGDELSGSDYGPREPARRIPVDPEEIDVVVAPGLAFDRRGHRLGYGGGHYDRFLARLGSGTPRVGIGFAAQVVDAVPAGPDDQRIDVVVTDREVIDCRPGAVES